MSPPCCLLSSIKQKSAEQTLRTCLSMAASPRPLVFGSGGKLVWHNHTLSCGYARLEGSLVRSQVQSEDKLQVSGVALASKLVYASHARARTKNLYIKNQIIETYMYVYAQSMDCPHKIRIHGLRRLRKSILCAQHTCMLVSFFTIPIFIFAPALLQ